jgi:hypothetical protein
MKKIIFITMALIISIGTADAKKTWKKGQAEWAKIQLSENFNYDTAFNTVLDLITDKYEMDMINKDGGYIRTAWSYMRNKKGKQIKDQRIRVTIKFNHDRSQLQARTEVQKGGDDEWVDGEDVAASKQVRDDIHGVLGY